MSITINIPITHRHFTGGEKSLATTGETVGEALKKLVAAWPAMEKELFDQKGELLNTMEIYINMESAYPNELARELAPGDTVQIATILSGG
ncbi:MAG: MoaD/ThiS family protein [Desulfobacteraceae bacterium]